MKKKDINGYNQMKTNLTPLIIRKLLMSNECNSTVLRRQELRINNTKLWHYGVQLEFLGDIVGARAKGYVFEELFSFFYVMIHANCQLDRI